MAKQNPTFKYPGTRTAMDGNTAVIMCERESTDAAGAYPITPSTQMGEYWAEETAAGHINVSGRPLIFIEPEGEHAAAGVTAGLSMTGLRATNFSSGQGVVYMHESLYPAVGKRLTYVLNMGCRAITKATLNVHAAHDDYHAVDDTGFFQVMGKSAQETCDLNIIAHKIAEQALNPGIVGQDGFLTTHLIESLYIPERELIAEFLGRPDDIIDTPTPAQKLIYGDKRRRIPLLWDVDSPMTSGAVQNQDSYMQAVAAQRPYFFAHIPEIADKAMEEFYQLTGRRYGRVATYRMDDAEYVIVGQGSMVCTAEAVADYLREKRNIKVGVVNVTMFRPFPGDLLGKVLMGKKGVAVLERTDQPLAEDLPLMREVRAVISKCLENGSMGRGEELPYPDYATYTKAEQAPRLFSGSYGLGSRDLQPEGIIGAVENMLPTGKRKKFFYLSIDFVRGKAASPKDEIWQQQVADAYPRVKELAVHGSENPNLMPKGCITVRFHSIGGWGAMTTGKNLAMTLFELLDYHIKANPKYGSEKKGQPTTYYLSAAPEQIRVNSEYVYVDVVLSPDPNVFDRAAPLSGLRKGGVFIIQSALPDADAVWKSFPATAQKYIIDNEIRVFYIDAFKIARDEASNAELQFRMQGIAFQGAFFAASDVMKNAGLTQETMFAAIKDQLNKKFGSKGARVVEDNLRVVRRGFDEVHEIKNKVLTASTGMALRRDPGLPVMLKHLPDNADKRSDIHRFWETVGAFYAGGGGDAIADPFTAQSIIPAVSGVFRDMSAIRFEYPKWIAENCTACGDCFNVCPDSAIPGLVNTVSEVFNTAVSRIETGGRPTRHLRRAMRTVEKKFRDAAMAAGKNADVHALLNGAIEAMLAETELEARDKDKLVEEIGWFKESIADFQFAITKVYYSANEKKAAGSGGLYSITVNPYACKGCMECVEVCGDDALRPTEQTADAIAKLRRDWDFWQALPTTSAEFLRIKNLDEAEGALKSLLLDKANYAGMGYGDGACLGCGEKTTIHLFTGTVTALMQGRVKKHLEHIDSLLAKLEGHIRTKLAANLDLSDTAAVDKAIDALGGHDITLARLTERLDEGKAPALVDADWLKRINGLMEKLRRLKWSYVSGVTNNGRARMGIVNATGCTSVWGSTYPYNPYPFPWTSHLFQDAPSVAMGVFEGHMTKMADGFKAVRMAELELKGEYDPAKHDSFFTYFDWRQFNEEEFKLCPPVVAIGGDGAMYDIGFQNLSRMLMSGTPIKVLVLDTQVYSNTGGQACTSGFTGQVSDMAPYASKRHGKSETRKEMSLIGIAHRTSYVMQGSISNLTNLIEGFIEGLNSRRPALFNIYAVCEPEHGVADDHSFAQSKLAVESRAYPLLRFNPDKGKSYAECITLDGNPKRDADWPTYKLEYTDENGQPAKMELPMTFADFAATEGRFRKHFKRAPREAWNDDMVPIAEFLDLDEDDRSGKYPYIWTVDGKNQLTRMLVSEEIVKSTAERRDLWRTLKYLSGAGQAAAAPAAEATEGAANVVPITTAPAKAELGAYEAAWVDTPECTACDECININSNIFAYNAQKKVEIVNPKGGAYKDIVKAAETCTAGCIHPGTPWDASEPGLEKLLKRAAKYK